MSSRRAKSKSSTKYNDNSKKLLPHEAPPNHPQEDLPTHRVFLARSLRRNDEDMAVLVDLNRTLHQVRDNITATGGEELLLDLGEGLFQLTPCERDLMVAPPQDQYHADTETRKEWHDRLSNLDDEVKLVCVDFLLRMKLRRRLINRLSRRLMRVSHAMDGEDVSPPVPPKYGDLRLHVDPEELVHAKQQWRWQEDAKQRITQFRLEHPDSLLPLVPVAAEVEPEVVKEEEEEKASTNSDDEEEEESGDDEDKKDKSDDEESNDDDSNNSKSDDDDSDNKSKSDMDEESGEEGTKSPEKKDSSKSEDVTVKEDEEDKVSVDKDTDKDDTDAEMKEANGDDDVAAESEKSTTKLEEKDGDKSTEKMDADDAKESSKSEDISEEATAEKDKQVDDATTKLEKVGDADKSKDAEMEIEQAKEESETNQEAAATQEPAKIDDAKVVSDKTETMEGEETMKDDVIKDVETSTTKTEKVEDTKSSSDKTETMEEAEATSATKNDVIKDEDKSSEKSKESTTVEDAKLSSDETEPTKDSNAKTEEVKDENKLKESTIKAEKAQDEDKAEPTKVSNTTAEKVDEEDKAEPTKSPEKKDDKDDAEEKSEGKSPEKKDDASISKSEDVSEGDKAEKDGDEKKERPKEGEKNEEDKSGDTKMNEVPAAEKPEDATDKQDGADKKPADQLEKKDESETAEAKDEITTAEKPKQDTSADSVSADNVSKAEPTKQESAKKRDTSEAEEESDEASSDDDDKMDVDESEEKKVKPKEPTDEASSDDASDDDDKMDVEKEEGRAKQEAESEEGDGSSKSADEEKGDESSVKDAPAAVKSEGTDDDDDETDPKPEENASTPTKSKDKEDEEEETMESPARKALIELPQPRDLSQLEKDHEILKEFVDAYTKHIDPITGEVTFQILNDERQEDYIAINQGVGVGAANPRMSLEQKEVEFKRWQTSLLGRIPEAPTLEEIGMKNNVFLLSERRTRLKQKREEEASKKRRRSSSLSKNDEGTPKKAKNIGAIERKSPAKKGKDEEAEEKKDVTKRMKPLPLVPFPSFYESDLRRIRIVHFDLMTASIRSSAEARYQASDKEYKAAFATSNQLLDRKVALENSLKQNMTHFETQFKRLLENYRQSVVMEKNRWLQKKAEYDTNRLQKLMPSSWSAKPLGTPLTQAVVGKYREGTIPHVVGTCVADIADVVIMKFTSNLQDQPFEAFKPSKQEPKPDNVIADPNTGETLAQKVQRVQQHFHQEINTAKMKLAQAEEERKRCWKKMEKLKLEVAQSQMAQNAGMRHFVPGMAARPPPSYTPGRRDVTRGIESFAPSGAVNTSESKYSVARVKERVHPDGTVEPINKKKGADGFYQRPAGRARKGMDWHPIRGVWVPHP